MDRISNSLFNRFAESLGMGDATGFASIYARLRHAETPYKSSHSEDEALEFAERDNGKKIAARQGRGWLWRSPYGKKNETPAITDRISLNVYPDVRMFETLDNIVADDGGRTIAYYKASDNLASWDFRHDPITIYLQGGKSSEKEKIISRIAREMRPFVRLGKEMANAVKIGTEVGSGVYYDAEPNGEKVKEVMDRIVKFPWAYKEIYGWLTDTFHRAYPNGMPVMSAGQFWILERFAEFVEERMKLKQDILKMAIVKMMDRSTGNNGTARYFIPNDPADLSKLKKLLDKHGTKTRPHDSELLGRKVLLEDVRG